MTCSRWDETGNAICSANVRRAPRPSRCRQTSTGLPNLQQLHECRGRWSPARQVRAPLGPPPLLRSEAGVLLALCVQSEEECHHGAGLFLAWPNRRSPFIGGGRRFHRQALPPPLSSVRRVGAPYEFPLQREGRLGMMAESSRAIPLLPATTLGITMNDGQPPLELGQHSCHISAKIGVPNVQSRACRGSVRRVTACWPSRQPRVSLARDASDISSILHLELSAPAFDAQAPHRLRGSGRRQWQHRR